MEKFSKEMERIADSLGWAVFVHEDSAKGESYVQLGQYAPSGDDLTFTVNADGFRHNVRAYAENFSVNRCVLGWLRDTDDAFDEETYGTDGPNIVQYLKDAQMDKDILLELADALDGTPHKGWVCDSEMTSRLQEFLEQEYSFNVNSLSRNILDYAASQKLDINGTEELMLNLLGLENDGYARKNFREILGSSQE